MREVLFSEIVGRKTVKNIYDRIGLYIKSLKKSMVQISIIISYYYRDTLVSETLSLLSDQSLKNKINIEIFIIDSNTNSASLNPLVATVSHELCSIRTINTSNNLSAKRNAGINNANGSYLIFLDDDCIPSANFLSDFMHFKFISSCICCRVLFPQPTNSYQTFRKQKEIRPHKSTAILKKNNYAPFLGVAMAFGIKKSLLLDYNLYFNESFNGYGWEDPDFFIRLTNFGIPIKHVTTSIQHFESSSFSSYYKKQVSLGSWFPSFLSHQPLHAKSLKHFILLRLSQSYPLLAIFGTFLKHPLKLIIQILNSQNINLYYVFELYFYVAFIEGLLMEPQLMEPQIRR